MENTATSQTTPATEQPNVELAQMMAMALGSETQQVQPAETQAQEVQIAESAPFQFEIFKEKFGYEKPEDVLTEIEQLRALKEAPPKVEPITFENDESKRLYEAAKSGNRKEVADIILRQEKLESLLAAEVTKENAADIIKMGMQARYKDLTPAQIEYKFNKQFALPKEPLQGLDESDEEYEITKQEWQNKVAEIEMEREIEAKLLKPELEAQKSKLVLPDIQQAVDEDYIQYKKSLEENEALNAETIREYQSFTPNTIETKINFKDEANKIDFNFEYVPSVEKFTSSKDMLVDIDKFFSSFRNQDGTPDRVGFAKAVHFAKNWEEILVSAMTQSKNATLKSILPDNSDGQRFSPDFKEPSELEKYMQRALS